MLKESSNYKRYLREKECLGVIQDRVKELYGSCPPIEVQERLAEEKVWFQYINIYDTLMILRKLHKHCLSMHGYMKLRGDLGNSFLSWLAGASNINPLPPHYYCPACKKVEFVPDVYSGWDLSAKRCTCGNVMKGDGHRLPLLLVRPFSYTKIDIDIPKAMLPEVEGILEEHYDDCGGVYQVQNKKADGYAKFVVGEEDKSGTDQVFCFYCNEIDSNIQCACHEIGFDPLEVDCSEVKLIKSLINNSDMRPYFDQMYSYNETHTLSYLLDHAQCGCFSDLLKLFGFEASAYKDSAVIDQMLFSKDQSETIAFREDVYEHLTDAFQRKGMNGDVLAANIATTARKGIYANRMDRTTEELLLSIGISQRYIQYMKEALYLFPRAHTVDRTRTYLIAEYLSMNNDILEKKRS